MLWTERGARPPHKGEQVATLPAQDFKGPLLCLRMKEAPAREMAHYPILFFDL